MSPAAAFRTRRAMSSASGRSRSTASIVSPSSPGRRLGWDSSSSIAAAEAAARVRSRRSTPRPPASRSRPDPSWTFRASNWRRRIILSVAESSRTRPRRVVADSIRDTPRWRVDSTRLATESRTCDCLCILSALSLVVASVTTPPPSAPPFITFPSSSSSSNPCSRRSGPATSSGASLLILWPRLSTRASFRSTSASASAALCRYWTLPVPPGRPAELAMRESSCRSAAAYEWAASSVSRSPGGTSPSPPPAGDADGPPPSGPSPSAPRYDVSPCWRRSGSSRRRRARADAAPDPADGAAAWGADGPGTEASPAPGVVAAAAMLV
mmetsp:Transcript_28065/g.66895  ORF Transcript_28065/g.66895 Transcript_28065/m.66895 type:complete len:325 (-) Transcript_28065:60-1034(-)